MPIWGTVEGAHEWWPSGCRRTRDGSKQPCRWPRRCPAQCSQRSDRSCRRPGHTGAEVAAAGGIAPIRMVVGQSASTQCTHSSDGVSVGAVVAHTPRCLPDQNLVSTVGAMASFTASSAVVADDQTATSLAALDASQAIVPGFSSSRPTFLALAILIGFNKDPYVLGLCFIACL